MKFLYALEFSAIPSIKFIGDLDATQVLRYVKEQYENSTASFYQYSFYDHEAAELFFNNTVLVLQQQRIIEVGHNYCFILHGANDYGWAAALAKNLAEFRAQPVASPATVVGFARQGNLN
ncbi:MAG: hypothetical protein JST81_03760 [Bacteroidetes bacterium]|nr:hypothetical protein [Bacteroidota bacterium]